MEILAGPYTEPPSRMFASVVQMGKEIRLRLETSDESQEVLTIVADEDGKVYLRLRPLSERDSVEMGLATRTTNGEIYIVVEK